MASDLLSGLDSGIGANGEFGAINSPHPYHCAYLRSWQQCRDTTKGQEAVKCRDGGYCYLPPTQSMWIDGGSGGACGNFRLLAPYSKGWRAYESYKMRALFIPFMKDALDMIQGMLWNKAATVSVPPGMEDIIERATPDGANLSQLMRQITYEQVVTGRTGLYADLSSNPTTDVPQPYICQYGAESIINWDNGFPQKLPEAVLNLVVLDECAPRRINMFTWQESAQYRVLTLGDPLLDEPAGTFKAAAYSIPGGGIPTFDPTTLKAPNIRGKTLSFIPFVFVGACGNYADPDDPPLLGLSDIALAVYRLEADYLQGLYMTTQDTLFSKGFTREADSPIRVGAGAHVHSDYPEADLKYVGVNSNGLPELRLALENMIKMAASRAGELMDASSRARESGSALEMRIGTKTATLNSIALAMGEGVERILKHIATWLGLDATKVKVIPNLEFASKEFASMDLLTIVQAKMLGGPISFQSIHKWAVERGYTTSSWEEMVAEIEEENKSVREDFQPLPPPAPVTKVVPTKGQENSSNGGNPANGGAQ